MTILLLGATGRTGRWILQEALDRGHAVHAIVRDPSRIGIKHDQLHLFEGTPDDPVILSKAMQGCSAILSALNVSRTSDWPWSPLRSPENLLSSTASALALLAPQVCVSRVIFVSAWGVGESLQEIPAWFRWAIRHSNLRYPYLDHERQEKIFRETSLDYTAIRAVGLTNGPVAKKIAVSDGKSPKPGLLISRKSVARFMLDILEKPSYLRQTIVVSGK